MTQPYYIVPTEFGNAVILDPTRAYATPIGDKLVISSATKPETLAAIDKPAGSGAWQQEEGVEIVIKRCICGKH